jgi:hypothetical protein
MLKQRSETGLRLVLGIGLLLAVTSCNSDGLLGINKGRVRLILSGDAGGSAIGAEPAAALAGSVNVAADGNHHGNGDDEQGSRPSWWFQTANVTLSSVLARNFDGVLVNLDMDLPVIIDVVQIEGGKEIQLPDATLPPGLYDQMVVVITAVQGLTHDGTLITMEPPGGGWTAVVPICPLEIVEGGTVTVGIKLMVRNSFRWLGHRFNFEPRFRPRINCGADDDDDDDEG